MHHHEGHFPAAFIDKLSHVQTGFNQFFQPTEKFPSGFPK